LPKTAVLTAAALLSILALGPLSAADAPRKTPSPDVPAEKFYKNIQVFQGLPSTELMPAMNFMANSLGVKCSYCHVTTDSGRWPVERDDKAAKGRAREMIRMTREINKANFKGRLEVTCATCHHGANDPISTPPLQAESAAAHSAGSAAAPAAMPSVDAVLEKYFAAVGGKDAIAKIRNRELEGSFTGGDGEPHPIEIAQTASGAYRSSVKVKEGSFTIVFDGKTGTSGGPSWNNPMQPDEVERIRSRARLFPAADLKERFPALAVRGSEKIDGRDAWLVTARAADGARMSFWFDAENGLLLRTLQRQRTALGDIPERADYSDYRDVGGVQVPFTIRHEAPDRGDTVAAASIRQNIEIPDSTFTAPEPEKKP
jgi:hypothetical protein